MDEIKNTYNRKAAIVTGGSSGIGRGIVYGLAEAGYDVAFSYRNGKERADKVLAELSEKYPDGSFYALYADLSINGEGIAFFHKAVKMLGRLDLMVNNAGITIKETVFDITEQNMDYLIQLLYRNYVLLMRESATYMAAHGFRGNIINISSSRGEVPHAEDLVYGSIKAGLNRACKSAALDVASYGIRVNNILPGATKRFTEEEESLYADKEHIEKVKYLSGRIPLERYGTPEDIANAVVFLASEKASYITGVCLTIDGGLGLPGLAETAADSAADGWGRSRKPIHWTD